MNVPEQAVEKEACFVAGSHRIPLGDADRVALLFVRIGAVLGDIADAQLAPADLNGRDYEILAILDSDGPDSQHELAELVGVAPGVIVAEIDALEGQGLVGRERDPNDRRRSRVALTAKGRAALKKGDRLADEAVAEVLSGLSAEERAALAETLAKGLGLPRP